MKKKKKKVMQGGGFTPFTFPLNLFSAPPTNVDPLDQMTQNIFSESLSRQDDYMRSPRYQEMLRNSIQRTLLDPAIAQTFVEEDPNLINLEYDIIDSARRRNLYTIPPTLDFFNSTGKNAGIAGYSQSDTGQIAVGKTYDEDGNRYVYNSYLANQLLPHEISHSVDRPNLDIMRYVYSIDNEDNRLIPTSDINLIKELAYPMSDFTEGKRSGIDINKNIYKRFSKDPTEGSYGYFTSPTEVRARLNEIRDKLYSRYLQNPSGNTINPLVEPITDPSQFNKLPEYKDLKEYFGDDATMKMLNTISDTGKTNANTANLVSTGGMIDPQNLVARLSQMAFSPFASPIIDLGKRQLADNLTPGGYRQFPYSVMQRVQNALLGKRDENYERFTEEPDGRERRDLLSLMMTMK